MSTVTVSLTSLTRAREVFLFYSRKSAFNIESEYVDAGNVFKRLTEAHESAQKNGKSADVSTEDVTYVVNTIVACSQRVPTEVQNYKPIADLLEDLTALLKAAEEETKENK